MSGEAECPYCYDYLKKIEQLERLVELQRRELGIVREHASSLAARFYPYNEKPRPESGGRTPWS